MKEWSEVKKPLTFCLRAFTRRTIRINSMMTPRPTIKSGKLETKLLMSSNFCTLAAELSSISTLWERQMTDSVFCSGVSPLRDLFPSDSRNTLTTELLLCKPADSTVSQNCQLIQVHFMPLIHPTAITGCHTGSPLRICESSGNQTLPCSDATRYTMEPPVWVFAIDKFPKGAPLSKWL